MFRRSRHSRYWISFLAALAVGRATGQEETGPTEGVRIFDTSYYAEFDPRSALELVYRTPGFQPQENDGGRGLAGVRSNILINGERPPPKGQSIRQQLREMPVYSIARIELIDSGARLDVDMQGYPQVVNVVTVENRPAYYEIETQVQRQGQGDIDHQNSRNTQVGATGTFSWRAHEFKLGGNFNERSNRSPSNFVSIDPANPEQRISSLTTSEGSDQSLDLNAIFQLPARSSLTFNGRFSADDNASAPLALLVDGQAIDLVDETFDGEDDRQDISAEFRRPFGQGGSLMFALVDAQSNDESSSSLTEGDIVRSSINQRETGETAARLLVTQTPTERLTVRTTATTAFNYFEGGFQLFENGVLLPIEGSDSRVEEDRHSLEGAVDWNLTEQWTFNGGLGVESYEIETRAVSSGLQSDPKGQISISYRPQPRTTLTLESERHIGQLSFNQFLASSNLSSEIVTAGAAELRPIRRWNHALRYDRRFGDRGVVRLSLIREKIDNPIRTVALSDSLTVAQNTSPRWIDGVQANFEFPFARFGREDLILAFDGRINDSKTVDPVTFETREVSGLTRHWWSVEMRRDPGDGRLAWNVYVGHQKQGENYSVRRINSYRTSREWGASVEWEVIEGLKVRTSLDGPRTIYGNSLFFGSVRMPGLDPSFIADSTSWTDRSASLQVEWRRMNHLEITASFSTRPKVRNDESLIAFGDTSGTLLTTRIAQTPRAQVRFRYYK